MTHVVMYSYVPFLFVLIAFDNWSFCNIKLHLRLVVHFVLENIRIMNIQKNNRIMKYF